VGLALEKGGLFELRKEIKIPTSSRLSASSALNVFGARAVILLLCLLGNVCSCLGMNSWWGMAGWKELGTFLLSIRLGRRNHWRINAG